MSTEEESVDPADPRALPLAHFGQEVRLERERLGISRRELGAEAHASYALVAKIEAGERVPRLEFAEACDRLFPDAHGRFVRLSRLVVRFAFPPWFRKYVELEERAEAIRMYHCQLVPGLLQTEAYARAIMAAGRYANAENYVTARMERQRILASEAPPHLWVILDEGVLRRVVGSREVMKEQLERLKGIAETPQHVIQVIPEDGRPYNGSCGPFGLLSFSDEPDALYVDGYPRGYVLGDRADVAGGAHSYDLLRADALSPEESALLIDAILKEEYS
ncbi:Scr1 family TA system antitoxin-like transcriptional regulator [Streptomyces gamaensis]|uniref:Scr1 family TA system antitoxin-like transcriptional regulator n=1 Tax=Streptomyces gamaensis TaxID=1763542 RepID=A0ABW0YYY5_9ACTN